MPTSGSIMNRTLATFVALVVVPAAATAQNQGGQGRGGGQLSQPSTTQSLSTPSSLSSTSSTGSGSTGSQSSSSFGSIGGSDAGGSSLFGGSSRLGTNGSGGNNSGFSQSATAQPFQFGQASQAVSGTGFVGGANPNGFVGNRLAGQQSSQNAFQQAFQALSRGGGGGNNNQFGGGNSAPKLGVRPTLKIAFSARTATPAAATARVSTRLTQVIDRRPELAGVTATTDGSGRLVLRGNVDSEEAGELAIALVRLEPGVGEVVNELTVAAEPAP